MINKSRKGFSIAFGALMAALSVVFLSVSAYVPSGRLAFNGIAGLFVGASVATLGYKGGLLCYGTAGILGLILLPLKSVALFFLLVFGLYPIGKAWIESRRNLAVEWILKLIYCNLACAVCLLLLRGVLLPGVEYPLGLIWAGAVLVFIVYDYAFTRLMTAYQVRLLPLLQGRRR